jgi:hypothetical protein
MEHATNEVLGPESPNPVGDHWRPLAAIGSAITTTEFVGYALL